MFVRLRWLVPVASSHAKHHTKSSAALPFQSLSRLFGYPFGYNFNCDSLYAIVLANPSSGLRAMFKINGFKSPIRCTVHWPGMAASPTKSTLRLKLNFAKPSLENKIKRQAFFSTSLIVKGVMPLILNEHWSPEQVKFSTLSSGKMAEKFLKSLKKSNCDCKVETVVCVSLLSVNAAKVLLFYFVFNPDVCMYPYFANGKLGL